MSRDVSAPGGRILVLDDEKLVLDTLRAVLDLDGTWSVSTFVDPARALVEVERAHFDVVVSDFLMPSMDGLTFLARVRDLQPLASRILLTGYADKENAIRSINEVGLYYYLEKPWDNAQLRMVLQNAAERSRLLRELDDKVEGLAAKDEALAELRAQLFKAIL
ncbi:MAG: response regulator [Acidobacteriota bacterium]|nr:MAG: response regulator [Acidobacteriota bacterium]